MSNLSIDADKESQDSKLLLTGPDILLIRGILVFQPLVSRGSQFTIVVVARLPSAWHRGGCTSRRTRSDPPNMAQLRFTAH